MNGDALAGDFGFPDFHRIYDDTRISQTLQNIMQMMAVFQIDKYITVT